ncbi:hypothetical protein AGDE_01929 [Angomonas deanei]|uniref:AB hydrolase-1 domain-containing protein n=1 Tax=Angomonas deanei TaxID=59799 RepID=A0A7G2CK85_9TRYP|nr:hypothetical protein AGDE_01929 [Angomonas deanei]CAD2219785.1 hypothetical protein, conserved [Angomonas deanei]|eukprot:EPY41994.1 hypothetical protein AGDE_01929 [Angomonas deanei]
MSKMLAKVNLFAVLGVVHLTSYTIPRLLHTLLVKVPVTIFELLTFKKRFTYFHEREIKVVASGREYSGKENREHYRDSPILKRLGFLKPLYYRDPLYSGHVHTLFAASRPSRRVAYTRETIMSEDVNEACMDWLYTDKTPARGVLLVNPGFGNYSQTPYVQQIARLAVKKGFHCVVHTMRAIGSAPLTEERKTKIGSAILTADIRAVARGPLQPSAIKARFGAALPVTAVGYSAGCTMLFKLMEEEEAAYAADPSIYPDGLSISMVVAMGVPYELSVRSRMMQSPVGKRLYQKAMVGVIQGINRKHKEKLMGIEHIPELCSDDTVDDYLEKASQSMEDYEKYMISRYHKFKTVEAYWDACDCLPFIRKIQKTLVVCVTAKDDPICGYSDIDWKGVTAEKPNVMYVETSTGGHLGYLKGPLDEVNGSPSFLVEFPVRCFDNYVREKGRSE